LALLWALVWWLLTKYFNNLTRITGNLGGFILKEEELFNLAVPVLRSQDVKVQFDTTEDLAVINPDDIKNALDEWNTKAQKRRLAAKEEWLKSLVDEYRSERRRELKE